MTIIMIMIEWRPSKRQHQYQPEYWEESWRLEETFCYSNSGEKPLANADVKDSQMSKIIESLLIAEQNNALRTNHIKARIDKTQQNSRCKLWGWYRQNYTRKLYMVTQGREEIHEAHISLWGTYLIQEKWKETDKEDQSHMFTSIVSR